MQHTLKRTVIAALAAIGIVAGTTSLVPIANASSILPAPIGVVATRDTANSNDFTVAWKPVTGAVDHYNVSVLYGGVDHVTTVTPDRTSLDVPGLDAISVYKITVSSRDVNGVGGTSSVLQLNPLVPGAPRGVVGNRDSAGTSLSLTWLAPSWLGYEPTTTYRVQLVRLADGVSVSDSIVHGSSTTLAGLDTSKQYSAKVTAENQFGHGASTSTWIGSDKPGTATTFKIARDAKSPGVVHVAWVPPAHLGSGPITYYEVLYGEGMFKHTERFTSASADVEIDGTRTGYVGVRSCNQAGCGSVATVLKVLSTTAKPPVTAVTTNPFVLVSNSGATVNVETRGYIGSNAPYPKLVFRVFPTMGNAGYTDTQVGQNGARVLTYSTVPAGTYTVTVSGQASTGKETELSRKVIIVGGYGVLTANQWVVVRGSATISGSTVKMGAGENRVLSTKPMPSADMVFSTDATLQSGSGYGIWFRAGFDSADRIFGYTFQYDPLYGNAFIIRHWYQGTECSTPIAKSPFPAGFAENVKHHLVVVVKGDTIWASVDGTETFRVNSLAAAIAASPCKFPLPQGTRIGFRNWNTSPVVFENTTLS